MKKLIIYIILFFVLSPLQSLAQQSLSGDIIMFNDADLIISMAELNGHYVFTITNKNLSAGSSSNKFSIPIENFDSTTFKKSMKEKLGLLIKNDLSKSKLKTDLENGENSEFKNLFYRFLGIISVKNNLTHEPVAGRLYYNKNVSAHRKMNLFVIDKSEIDNKSTGYTYNTTEYGEIKSEEKTKKKAIKDIVYQLERMGDLKQKEKLEGIEYDIIDLIKEIKNYNNSLEVNFAAIKEYTSNLNELNISASKEELELLKKQNLSREASQKIERLLSFLSLNAKSNQFYDLLIKNRSLGLLNILNQQSVDSLYIKREAWKEVVFKVINSYEMSKDNIIENGILRLANITDRTDSTIIANRIKSDTTNISVMINNIETDHLDNLETMFIERIKLKGINDSIQLIKGNIAINSNNKTIIKEDLDSIDNLNKVITDSISDRKESVIVSMANFKKLYDEYYHLTLRIDSIQIEINEGYIENMSLTGTSFNSDLLSLENEIEFMSLGIDYSILNSAKRIHFQSRGPIGFSELNNYINLKRSRLMNFGSEKKWNPKIEIKLEDVMEYIPVHQVNRRDYSPANQKVVLWPNSLDKIGYKDLYKETRINLFELKIFTDFEGIVNPEKPNGLLQMQIDKRLNLRSNRTSFELGQKFNLNLGAFQFITPTVIISKIESENRRLPLTETLKSSYASTLDIKLYQDLLVGYDLNLVQFDIPAVKTTFYLNSGMYFGSTAILDTTSFALPLQSEYGANTYEIPLKTGILFRHDENFEFGFSFAHNWLYLRDNRFEQVANSQFFERTGDESKNNRFHYNTFDFMVTYNPHTPKDNKPINSTGRWFFRYRYNWQQGFARTGFSQFQVGHSVPLLSKIKEHYSKID